MYCMHMHKNDPDSLITFIQICIKYIIQIFKQLQPNDTRRGIHAGPNWSRHEQGSLEQCCTEAVASFPPCPLPLPAPPVVGMVVAHEGQVVVDDVEEYTVNTCRLRPDGPPLINV